MRTFMILSLNAKSTQSSKQYDNNDVYHEFILMYHG